MQHPDDAELSAFAIDALPPEVMKTVAGHISACATCQRAVDSWRVTVANLALAAPSLPMPAGIRERVLNRALRAPKNSSEPRLVVQRPRATRWPLLAAAATAVLAIGLGAALRSSLEQRERLSLRLAEADSLATEQSLRLAARDSLLARVLGPEVEIATLAATGAAPSLRLYWHRARGEMVLAARRLPPVESGRAYQLWGIGANGTPVGLGTFNTGSDGSAVLTLAVRSAADFEVSAITIEPTGGSPAPTTAPILVGSWPSANPIR